MRLFCIQYLTRPSNTNKNFPYHISTNQVRIYLVTQLSRPTFLWTPYFIKNFRPNRSMQYIHCESKNKTPNSCPQLHQMLTDFQNSFTAGLSRKFVTKSYLNTPPHPKRVATLLLQLQPFNGLFSRTTWVSRYQIGKINLDLLEQETVSGSGISWAICKSDR